MVRSGRASATCVANQERRRTKDCSRSGCSNREQPIRGGDNLIARCDRERVERCKSRENWRGPPGQNQNKRSSRQRRSRQSETRLVHYRLERNLKAHLGFPELGAWSEAVLGCRDTRLKE